MIRGIYTAASGMVAEMTRTDVTANNLANASTAGFKKDVAVSRDFASVLITRINDGQNVDIGTLGRGAMIDEVAVDRATGTMQQTGNQLDFAIEGKGYFMVETPNGVRYTKNGTFTRSNRGELVTNDGYRVLGQNNQPITVNGGKVTVSPQGTVSVDGVQAGQLQVVEFADEKQLSKEGSSLYIASPNARQQPSNSTVSQGNLEMSNVNVVAEMVNLITGYRAYETNSKAVQAHDQLLDKAVNEVGRVS